MNQTHDFLTELRTNAWRTSGARFNASRRLNRRDVFATFSIAMFSAIAVSLSLITKLMEKMIEVQVADSITVLTICLGLFIIVISLIEWGSRNAVKSDSLYKNAEELSEFQRELHQAESESSDGRVFSRDEITEFRKKYERVKGKCPFNHDPIDDLLFQAYHRSSSEFQILETSKSKISWVESLWIRVKSFFSSIWMFGIFWLIIILISVLSFCKV